MPSSGSTAGPSSVAWIDPVAASPLLPSAVADGDLPIHHMPGHHIRRLQQVAVELFARTLAAVDITPVQYAVLSALAKHRAIPQATVSALIGYDRATIGGVIDRLEAKSWLRRRRDPSDRRVWRLELTPAGRKVLRTVTPQVERVQESLLAPLDDVERRDFERLCLKLLRHHDAS